MMRRLLALALAIGMPNFSVLDAAIVADQRLQDTGGVEYEYETSDSSGLRHKVRRVRVEHPYYLGPLNGFEVIMVRVFDERGRYPKEEVLTSLVPGVLRLSAYDPSARLLYGFMMKPQGASFVISALERFSKDYPDGKIVGPLGAYQYASCDPSARNCLLVSDRVMIVDLRSGAVRALELPEPIAPTAADPPVVSAEGDQESGGELSNLSGMYMEALWGSGTEVSLVIRDLKGHESKVYRINLKQGRLTAR